MSMFWRNWLAIWCLAVAIFGIVLMGGAFAETSAPIRLFFAVIDPANPLMDEPQMRFALALMGAISVGWSVTLYTAVRAADLLGDHGGTIWRWLTTAMVGWFIIDSSLSIATGFALNAVSNLLFIIGYLVPIMRSGVLRLR